MERANGIMERISPRYYSYSMTHLINSFSDWEAGFNSWQTQSHVADLDESPYESSESSSSWMSPWKNAAEFIGNVITPFILNPRFVCSLVDDYFGAMWRVNCYKDFEL